MNQGGVKRKRLRNRKPKQKVPNIKSETNNINTESNQQFKRKRNQNSKDMTENNAAKQTVLTYPKVQENMSSNWKKLLETLETSKTEGQIMESPKSSRKRINPTKIWKQPRNLLQQNKNDETEAGISELRQTQKRKNTNRNETTTLSKSPKLIEKRGYASVVKNGKKNIWFDGVDPELLDLEPAQVVKETTANTQKISEIDKKENCLTKPGSFKGLTKTIGIDCEMVGVGPEGQDSILARVSLVNLMGHCVYDKFVKPSEPVTDYRTEVSGVRSSDLEKADDFTVVQKEVCDLLHGRILVGHAVYNDLKVLYLGHPKSKIRDTSTYKPFRQLFGGATPSLKKLAERLLGVKVQQGEHSSVQDAQAAMRLYTMYKRTWESEIKQKLSSNRNKSKKSVPFSPGTTKMSQLKI